MISALFLLCCFQEQNGVRCVALAHRYVLFPYDVRSTRVPLREPNRLRV